MLILRRVMWARYVASMRRGEYIFTGLWLGVRRQETTGKSYA
jgi:hypothetical protein